MPRLKTLLQEKRNVSVVATSGTVTYKIPMGAESLGHFVSQEIVDNELVVKFTVKLPPAVVEDKEFYEIKFN
jgi:hypothetical protein